MSSNPLRHVGQTARPEDAASTPAEQAGDDEARQQNVTDAAGGKSQVPVKKEIKDLKPGEPPPESSAGS